VAETPTEASSKRTNSALSPLENYHTPSIVKKARVESPDLLNNDFGDILGHIHTQTSVISSSMDNSGMPKISEKMNPPPRRYSRFMVVLRMGTDESNSRIFKLLCCDDTGDLLDTQITVYLRDDHYDITENINPGEYLNIVGMIPNCSILIIDSKRYLNYISYFQSVDYNYTSRHFDQRDFCRRQLSMSSLRCS
jgi:hypothetical protein